MNTVINALDNISGWTGNIAVTLNEHEQFIAHNNNASLILTPSNDLNEIASLTLNTDLTGYEYIVLDCMSQYKGVNKLSNPTDANYLIDFGFQKYYFPAPSKFGPVRFKIAGTETITKIEITALHAERDVLIISNLQAIKEQSTLDIPNAIASSISLSEYEAGTATGTAGQNTITVSNPKYIDKYARIRLGANYYGVERISGNTVTINTLFNGASGLASTFSGTIYMAPLSARGIEGREVTSPAVTVWMDTPDLVDVDDRMEYRLDTYKYNSPNPDSVDVVLIGDNYATAIQIDCESQYQQVLHDMVKSVKNFVAKRTLWVNGVQLEFTLLQTNREEGEIEKVSFIIALEFAEEKWDQTQKFPLSWTTTTTTTITVQ